MENEISKIIAEYQQKIDSCDTLLNAISEERKSMTCVEYIQRTSLHRREFELETQRQAYMQALKDFERLLDYCGAH